MASADAGAAADGFAERRVEERFDLGSVGGGVGLPAEEPPSPAVIRPQSAPLAARADLQKAEAGGDAREAAEALAADLIRMWKAGELNEARRRPEACAGGDTLRVAWFDGWGKARRFARTAPMPEGGGEATRDQYYDQEARLRLVRIDGTGPAGRFIRRIVFDADGRRVLEEPDAGAPWPASDLTTREPAAVFWGPQRCAGR